MSPAPNTNQPEAADGSNGRVVSSDRLLDGRREVIIEHAGERYRLLLTRSNKLILIK